MKRILALALAFFLLPAAALAQSMPANPMNSYQPPRYATNAPTDAPAATDAPTDTPVPADTPVPTDTPEPTEAPNMAPAAPEDDYYLNDVLDEDIIAQLDKEIQDYLIGTGELLDTVDGVRNILLVGIDARPGEGRTRSDTMIVLTIDGNNNAIRLTSFLRDLYVAIPGHGNNRINAAWVWGGFDLLKATLLNNFGLSVDEYVAVDMTLLTDLIDQIGGLTLTVESEKQLKAINGVIDGYNSQFKEPNNDGILTELGEQHMNGKQVQAYARYRKIDSDFKRTERQREVLTLIFEKLQTMSLVQLTKLASYAIARVDTNLSLSDVISLIPVMLNMKDVAVEQLTIPYDGEYQSKTVSKMAVLVPNLSAAQKRLQKFVYGE